MFILITVDTEERGLEAVTVTPAGSVDEAKQLFATRLGIFADTISWIYSRRSKCWYANFGIIQLCIVPAEMGVTVRP